MYWYVEFSGFFSKRIEKMMKMMKDAIIPIWPIMTSDLLPYLIRRGPEQRAAIILMFQRMREPSLPAFSPLSPSVPALKISVE